MSSSQALVCLPVFADWKADLKPVVPLISRTGQLMNIDLFASQSNYNCCIAAQSGSGKSFLVNEMVANYLATGAQCWIIDVGRSYKRLCEVYNGTFLEFTAEAQINMNPFHMIHDFVQDADMLNTLIHSMLSPKDNLDDFQKGAIKAIIQKLWETHGKKTSIDMLASSFRESRDRRIQDLATQIFPYTSKGSYGQYFRESAPNMIDLLHDLDATIESSMNEEVTDEATYSETLNANVELDKINMALPTKVPKSRLIVLELEELSGRKDLQSLVLLQLIFAINQYMIGNRSRQKVIFIDEAWDLLANKTASHFIENGYRRFRKYQGAVVTITQSLEDLYNTPSGLAIAANSASIFLLAQKPETVRQLINEGKLILEESAKQQIYSLKTLKGVYSEIFIRNDRGYGVARLIVDPKTQLLYSTNAVDTNELDQIKTKFNCGYLEAINHLLEKRKQGNL